MEYKAEIRIEKHVWDNAHTYRVYMRDMENSWRWFGRNQKKQFLTQRGAQKFIKNNLDGYTQVETVTIREKGRYDKEAG